MNGKANTWKDLLSQRGTALCIGRERECELFRLSFLYTVPKHLVFAVTGESGMGKSALLRQFKSIAAEQGAITLITDRYQLAADPSHAILQTLACLAEQLKAAGTSLTVFQEQYAQYLSFIEAVSQDPEAPGPWLGLVGGQHDADPWARQAWDAYLAHKLPHRAMMELVNAPAKVLTETFVRELNAWSMVRRFVICFDDWQLAEPCLGEWLRGLLLQGVLSLRIWVILVSRQALAPSWKPLRAVTAQIAVQPFSSEAMSSYVEAAGITDPARAHDIATFAGGSPVWARLLMSVTGGIAGDLALTPLDRYLKWLTDPLERSLILGCSAARRLAPDVMAALMGAPADIAAGEARLTRMLDASAAVETSAGWAMPEVFRNPLHGYAQQAAPAIARAAHVALYDHYRARGLDPQPPAYQDADSRTALVEAVYHGLMLGEAPARSEALRAFLSMLRLDVPLAGEVAAAWKQAAEEQVVENDTTRLAAWVAGGWEIARTGDWQSALDICEELPEQFPAEVEADPRLRQALEELQSRIASRIPKAPTPAALAQTLDVTAAAPAPPEELPQAPSQPDAAVSATEPAVHAETPAAPEPPELPDVSPEDAQAVATEAAEAPAMIAEPSATEPESQEDAGLPEAATLADYLRHADAALRKRAFADAVRGYTQALELDPTRWGARYNRALAQISLGEYALALEDLTLVVQANPYSVAAHRERALVHSRLGQLEAALGDYSRAIELDPENAMLYSGRGNIHQKRNAYDAAIEDYDQAIRLSPADGDSYLNRGLAHAAQGAYVQAIADYEQAIALQPDQPLAYHYRGQAYAKLAQYAQALDDYALALTLNPGSAAVYVSQGLVYAREQAYEKAIDSHERAIAIDTKHAPAHYNAACAAALLGDVERACGHLQKAIELRPGYRQMAAQDPDFAQISRSSEFQALVAADR